VLRTCCLTLTKVPIPNCTNQGGLVGGCKQVEISGFGLGAVRKTTLFFSTVHINFPLFIFLIKKLEIKVNP
jgi:hypothetical protein